MDDEEPRIERLMELGISREEFEAALPQALDDFHASLEGSDDLDAAPGIDEIGVSIRGKRLLLGDVVDIRISEGTA